MSNVTALNVPTLPTLASMAQSAEDARTPHLSIAQRMVSVRLRGLWIIGLWLALFLGWVFWAPISGGVVASGLVKVEANRRTVTHRDGGTVARIPVKEGQLVKKGDVLLELADVRLEASVDLLRAQLAADRLRQSRLEAEIAGAGAWQPAAALLAEFKDVKTVPELARKERASFQARQGNLAAQILGDQQQAQSTEREIQARLRERENTAGAIQSMKAELALNQQLADAQFVNRTRIMGLERNVNDYESRRLTNEAELAQAQQRLSGLRTHEQTLKDNLRQTASDELREVSVRISDTEQRLRSSQDDRSRQTVLAPEDGQLMNLRINTPGSALGPREPIVDIVPANAPLVIEARIPLETGADVRPGTQAEVRIVTAHSRNTKLLAAEVVRVSADAVEDPRSGAAYLNAVLHVAPEVLKESGMPMQPGLPAEVYLKVTERTPLGFLMEPITGYFHRSFRER
jgi:HlyD family type I secretion membrane fusion protein